MIIKWLKIDQNNFDSTYNIPSLSICWIFNIDAVLSENFSLQLYSMCFKNIFSTHDGLIRTYPSVHQETSLYMKYTCLKFYFSLVISVLL